MATVSFVFIFLSLRKSKRRLISRRAANIVLSDAYERVYVGKHYGDIPVKGWFIARAENVVLVGELDGKEADVAALTRVDADKIQELRKEERARDAEKRKFLADVLDEMQILDEF